MDASGELKDFLASRRERITPAQAGIAPGTGRRRVPGLRREEVAGLAGVSTEYYTRLEQGGARGVSEEVLHAVASALQLDEAERAHLFDLTAALGPARSRKAPRAAAAPVRAGMQTLLDTMTGAAAVLTNERTDIVAANALGRAFYADLFARPERPVNHARFIFLAPAARTFHRDWDTAANNAVALLRAAAGRNPFDKELSNLVGELSTRSDDFRILWGAHDVRRHTTGLKRFHHRQVGDLDLNYEYLTVTADEGLSILAYYAAPGTAAADGLHLLVTLAAADEHVEQPST